MGRGLLVAIALTLGCTRAQSSDAGRQSREEKPLRRACPTPTLLATRAFTPIRLEGHMDEEAWRSTESSGPFLLESKGTMTSPHSELRAVWTTEALVLGLYAADEDLRASDAFEVELEASGAPLALSVPAKGVSAASKALSPGVTVAVDVDGTLDAPSDDDEEWIAEVSIPWRVLGAAEPLREVRGNVRRTDTPKGAQPRTTMWACEAFNARGRIVLRPPPGSVD